MAADDGSLTHPIGTHSSSLIFYQTHLQSYFNPLQSNILGLICMEEDDEITAYLMLKIVCSWKKKVTQTDTCKTHTFSIFSPL